MSKKARSGSAMGLVLVFMVMMIILGTGVLAMAQYGAVHSAGTLQADKHYYAAESAAQLASQMFLQELDLIAEKLNDEDHADLSIEKLNEEIADELELSVGTTIIETLKSMKFNSFEEETVSLKIDLAGVDISEEEGDEEGETKYVYDCDFVINATSGGRTVSASVVNQLVLSVLIETTPDESVPVSLDGGAYYGDSTGGVYGTSESASNKAFYDALCAALKELFDNARKLEVIPDIPAGDWHTFSDSTTFQSGNASAYNTSKCIKVTDNLTLNLNNTSASNLALEYLDVTGDLTIKGTNYVPNLKGVRVGGKITISSGAKVYGWKNGGASPYGTDFTSQGNISITAGGTVINSCRFYAQGANITISASGSNTDITTNSIFVATKDSSGSGGNLSITGNSYQVETDGDVPQYYAETRLRVELQNNHTSVIGIFGTLSTDEIFIDGGAKKCTVVGIVIGKCNTLNNLDNGLKKLSSEQAATLMEGGVLKYISVGDDGYEVTPGGIKTTISYGSEFSGLNIRETTGEQP